MPFNLCELQERKEEKMLRIYTELELFEEILFQETDKVLLSVMDHHADVLMNINDADLEAEEEKQEIIFLYQKAQANRGIIPLEYHFQNLDGDNENYNIDPRAIYIRQLNDADRDKIATEQGVVILNGNNISDHSLDFFFDKDLDKDDIYETGKVIGWHDLLPNNLPPCNAIVISDNHLFDNEDGRRGEANVCQLLSKILPDDLVCDFHVLLVALEHKNYDKNDCSGLCGRIKTHLTGLNKKYNIIFEMAFASTIHKRIAISNYYSIVMDKGFDIFKTEDLKTVHEDSDIQIKGIFKVYEKDQTTGLMQSNKRLRKIRSNMESVKEYISNRKEDKNHRIFGDCNKDKSIKNRLLQDFDKH